MILLRRGYRVFLTDVLDDNIQTHIYVVFGIVRFYAYSFYKAHYIFCARVTVRAVREHCRSWRYAIIIYGSFVSIPYG